jgi:hypothetical protein
MLIHLYFLIGSWVFDAGVRSYILADAFLWETGQLTLVLKMVAARP